MMDQMQQANAYRSEFERLCAEHAATEPGWFGNTRKNAWACFQSLGFPDASEEDWRFTNIAEIARTEFQPGRVRHAPCSARDMEAYLLRDAAATLVFVNGRFQKEASSRAALPAGMMVEELAGAMASDSSDACSRLTQLARHEAYPLVALNTALFREGALVYVPREACVQGTIQLLFVTDAGTEATMTHPRVLIVTDAGSSVSVVETYIGSGRYFTNAVTEIDAGAGSIVDHYKIGRESDDAYHLSTLAIAQGRDSRVSSQVIALNGKLARHDINTRFGGEGGTCNLRGLSVVGGDRHVDNHLRIDHAKAHCDSREFFKSVVGGTGRSVFTGRIMVREGAQKTDAKQTNQTLLLSREARVESRPQLEILADDVKCTHGATVGQIDETALFYLRSRGLSQDAARSLLVYGFARACLDEIKLDSLKRQMAELVLTGLDTITGSSVTKG
ncbi:MAG: Fe-S cluster assembly protein SufD [Phycisphaerae bacterium]